MSDTLVTQISKMYIPMPYSSDSTNETMVWRVIFEVASDVNLNFALEINGEVVLGRSANDSAVFDLTPYGADTQGVSRRHACLRPKQNKLLLVDLESTNGTLHNGRSVHPTYPTPLQNGDTINLGDLRLVINIVKQPEFESTTLLTNTFDLADAMSDIARTVTTQLKPDDVFTKVVETAKRLTAAGEAGIWLQDEENGGLYLEASEGMEEAKLKNMRLTLKEDSLAGQVVLTDQTVRSEGPVEVRTGYLVGDIVYAPIKLHGEVFGVLSASHKQKSKRFSKRDERLLEAIADFAAIAIQNARRYQATDEALADRVKELSALDEVSRAVSSSLDLKEVYRVLVEQLKKRWDVTAVRIYLLNEPRDALFPLQPQGTHHNNLSRRPIAQGIMGQVATSGIAVFTNDVPNHPNYHPKIDHTGGNMLTSMACVPLKVKKVVVGVLTLFDKADNSFVREDLKLLEAFANPVATAIENARLFSEARKQKAVISATAKTLSQPLMILDTKGRLLVSNKTADNILENHMAQLFDGIGRGSGGTTEVTIKEQTYLTTAQHVPEIGTIIVMQDITYVKQLETDRAEFMRALSHDLKTPLTSIRGFAKLLPRVLEVTPRGHDYINRIVDSSDRMLDMINQLLQVARSDKVNVEQNPCDMVSLIQHALRDVEGHALHKEIAVKFRKNGRDYPVIGDETRLYHMSLNLIDNAVKYSPEKTTVHVTLNYSQEGMLLLVRDEGNGIPEDDLTRVFDKYYRGNKAKAQPGAGLGLSVVWGIAEAHSGRASVRNHPNGGAEFAVFLPQTR